MPPTGTFGRKWKIAARNAARHRQRFGPMFGLSSLAALAISDKVARAVARHGPWSHPPVAAAGLIDARLQAIRDELPELTAAARDVAELEQILARASARIEEWTP